MMISCCRQNAVLVSLVFSGQGSLQFHRVNRPHLAPIHELYIAVDSKTNPTMMQVRIKGLKLTAKARNSYSHWENRLQTLPYCGNDYIPQSEEYSPMFCNPDRSPLTRPQLVARLREVLARASLDPANFSRHFFWVGAATTAAAVIQTLYQNFTC